MPEPKIIFAPVLDDEVRAIGEGLLPKGFALEWTAAADVPNAIQDADFLCGFIGPLTTEALVSAAENARLNNVAIAVQSMWQELGLETTWSMEGDVGLAAEVGVVIDVDGAGRIVDMLCAAGARKVVAVEPCADAGLCRG